MPLNAPDITVDLDVNDECDGLTFQDTTGAYNASTNVGGYGLPGGIATSDIDSAILKLEYSTLGTYIQFNFTVVTNVVTAATLSVGGADSTSILSSLASTTFPFTSANEFDFSRDYDVTIPDFEDGIYYLTYTIAGNTPEAFTYTVTQQVAMTCSTACCIAKMFQELDANCGCSSAKLMTALRAQSYLLAAKYSTEVGYIDNAVAALNKASDICENNCGGC